MVPIFDVESFLQECLDSLAAQTVFGQTEVVLVDDGSTDGSSDIARSWAARFDNVLLHRQDNAGLGAARNAGLRLVSTDWVTFLDSDDVLPANSLELLLSGTGAEVDVVVGRMQTFPVETRWAWLTCFDEGTRELASIADAPDLVHSASACNKLFRTSYLRRAGLHFGEGVHFEDVYVTLPALTHARTIALVDALVYLYRKRGGGSIMDSVFARKENFWDHLAAEEFLASRVDGLDERTLRTLQSFMVRSFQGFVLRAPQELDPAELKEFFLRAQRVYADVPADVVREATLDVRHRRGYAGILAGDFELFADPASAVRDLRVDAGTLTSARPIRADLQDLLSVDRVTAHIESVQAVKDGSAFTVRGRYSLGGLSLEQPPGLTLRLRVRGSKVTVKARLVERMDFAHATPERRYSGFEAIVPARRLHAGTHHLRLVLGTPDGGQISTRCRPTPGYFRSARPLRAAGVVVTARVDREDACQLDVAQRTAAPKASVAFWRAAAARPLADVGAFLRREPMSGLKVLRLLTLPLFRRRRVWVLGERRDTAQDNSAALFRHLRTHGRDDVYYVIDGKAPQRANIAALGNVVRHGSLRHRLLMLHARLLVGSYDIDGYLLPRHWSRADYHRHLAWRVGSRRAFLQHGVIYNDVSAPLHRGVTGLDLFVASSEREAEFLRATTGYGRREVRTLGLPRFDTLERRPHAGTRVLFMPTWRSYLVSPSYAPDRTAKVPFAGSDYQRFLTDFLNHPRLRDALERVGAQLEFLPHYEIAGIAQDLFEPHPRIGLAHHEDRDIQRAVAESDLFVTDWSSVFFDAARIGIPTVLAPFDEEEFRAGHYKQGYFDLETDGFGPVARDVTSLVDATVGYLESGCIREPVFDARAREFFAFEDTSNCQRVTRALDGLPGS